MRLLNINTLKFQDFDVDSTPVYLATSHRWTSDEVTYKDVLKDRNKESRGFKKVKRLCRFARRYCGGQASSLNEWIWIDTYCIDQRSSAEVSESIKPMWYWYTNAAHCIAYLHDVRPLQQGWDAVMCDFRRSKWFERGWTLQELLAPRCVIFLSSAYEIIGRKSDLDHRCPIADKLLNQYITEVTGIHQDVLCGANGWRQRVRKDIKMSWAANRKTTRVEDEAYSLLGIFNVHMPMLYGEGRRNARKRLEQEIERRVLEEDDLDDLLSPRRQRKGVSPKFHTKFGSAEWSAEALYPDLGLDSKPFAQYASSS